MGTLSNSKHSRILEPEYLVGRSRLCHLRLSHGFVSAEHASFHWNGEGWEINDLGSLNGTYIDGVRIPTCQPEILKLGSIVAFGRLEENWELTSDEPPKTLATPINGGEPVVIDCGMLSLPASGDPQCTVFKTANGIWQLERADGSSMQLENGSIFEGGGQVWRFSCPDTLARTLRAEQLAGVSQVRLAFAVSRDQEYVRVRAQWAGKDLDLGAYSAYQLLLALARQRIEDKQRGEPEATSGWVYQDELTRKLAITDNQTNVDIFRIRKQFARIGISDAASTIERRNRTRQLRIGTSHLTLLEE